MLEPSATAVTTLGSALVPSPLRPPTGFVPDTARVRYQVEVGTGADLADDIFFVKAGPRQRLLFDPARTTAAIVTCGGISPGLNNVIRSAFLELHFNYGVRRVLGLRYGYAGLNPALGFAPVELSLGLVENVHEEGGSLLGSSRGAQEPAVMVDFLADEGVDLLLAVGGDGTLRGAHAISLEAARRGLSLAVVGVPKTIDNDVMYVSQTFGLITATDMARTVLDCAHNEARGAANGVGLVKLMGREAGFIAATATVASQEVNFCLIPEVPFALAGPDGLLAALERRLRAKAHAVVVVAEGAGQDLIQAQPQETDASGNPRRADIGPFLKEQIVAHGRAAGLAVEVKYFDPSYLVRSVAANTEDALLCDQLARHAVHAGMAGATDVVVGLWNDAFTLLPIPLAVSARKTVDPAGPLWASVLAATGQPARMA